MHHHPHVGTLREGRTVTLAGAGVNALLIIVKAVGGIIGNSTGLIADAFHSISDLFTDIIVLAGITIGGREPDATHHFGHARFETFSSLAVGITLLAIGVSIGGKAALNITLGTVHHPASPTLVIAALSILLKELMYRWTIHVGRRIASMALIANAWHHRSDALSSVAVFIGLLGTLIHPSWYILDDWAALIVSVLILKAGMETGKSAFDELTDKAPAPNIVTDIRNRIIAVPGIDEVHDLRIRRSGGRYQMEVHIGVNGALSVTEGHSLAEEAERIIRATYPRAEHVAVHVEPTGEKPTL